MLSLVVDPRSLTLAFYERSDLGSWAFYEFLDLCDQFAKCGGILTGLTEFFDELPHCFQNPLTCDSGPVS